MSFSLQVFARAGYFAFNLGADVMNLILRQSVQLFAQFFGIADHFIQRR
jgi:hypothetical protein